MTVYGLNTSPSGPSSVVPAESVHLSLTVTADVA